MIEDIKNLRMLAGATAFKGLTADMLSAAADKLEEAHEALNEISCPTQSKDLLWWQERARKALSKVES